MLLINPCSKCGTDNLVFMFKRRDGRYFLCCNKCGKKGPAMPTAAEARVAWDKQEERDEKPTAR